MPDRREFNDELNDALENNKASEVSLWKSLALISGVFLAVAAGGAFVVAVKKAFDILVIMMLLSQ